MAITERKYRCLLCTDDLFAELETLLQDLNTSIDQDEIKRLREECDDVENIIKGRLRTTINDNALGLIMDRLPITIYKHGSHHSFRLKRREDGLYICFYEKPNGDFCWRHSSYNLKDALLELEEHLREDLA